MATKDGSDSESFPSEPALAANFTLKPLKQKIHDIIATLIREQRQNCLNGLINGLKVNFGINFIRTRRSQRFKNSHLSFPRKIKACFHLLRAAQKRPPCLSLAGFL